MARKKTWLLGLAVLIVLVALLAWAFAPRPVEVEAETVSTGPFQTGIEEQARTRLRDTFMVSAPLSGELDRITLREGDPVAEHDVVATLRALAPPLHDLRTQRELQARKLAGAAQVARAAARLEAAEAELRRLESALQRTEQLARQGFVAESRLEAERLGTIAARKERDAAAAERRIATFELEQAAAALLAANGSSAAAPASFALRAPITGRVLRVLHASEGVVTLGTELIELGNLEHLEVVAELLSADAVKADPGSLVRIERWGGAPLQGRVRRIEPAAFTKISALGVEEQRVEVLIDIVSDRELWRALGANFRVHVHIVTLALEQARKVPVGAVFPLPGSAAGGKLDGDSLIESGSGERAGHAVYVIESGHARLRPIVLGARNERDAWVRKGLLPGQRVIVYPPEQVRDGVRVRERSVEARR